MTDYEKWFIGVRQSPRQASVEDVERLCERVEKLETCLANAGACLEEAHIFIDKVELHNRYWKWAKAEKLRLLSETYEFAYK